MADDQLLVIPVGQFGGVTRDPRSGRTSYTIRRGHDVVSVEPAAGRLWLDAHSRPDLLDETALTRSVLLGEQRDLAPDRAATTYEWLLDNGLVVEVELGRPSAVEFARTHRLVPTADGLGNRPGDPLTYMAGFPPDRVVGFTWHQYRLWRRSQFETSLWDGCEALATDPHAARPDVSARDVLAELLDNVHVLLCLGTAHVDLARLPRDAGPADHRPPRILKREVDPDELLLPIGHDLGPHYRGPDEPLAYHEICVGVATFGLPGADDYSVWSRGRDPVDRPPLTYRQYYDALIADGIPDAGGLAYRLADNGLLRQIPATGDAAADFANEHRLMPLATAVVDADVPEGRYALGRPGVVLLHADEVEYWLWLRAGRFDSLWLACEALARSELGARTGDGDPFRCIGPVMLAAQNLVIHSLAYLDASWDLRR